MALPVTITGISTAVAPVGPFKVAAGNYSAVAVTTGGSQFASTSLTGSGASTAVGQGFTNPTAGSLVIASAAVQLLKPATAVGDVYAEIRATDVNGSVLATSTSIAVSSLPASFGAVTFTFPSPPTIAGSATFALVLQKTVADANIVAVGVVSGSVYAGGAPSTFNGTTWTGATNDWWAASINSQTTIASDAYYFFARDGTTATTLQAYKPTLTTIYSITPAATTTSDNIGSTTGNVRQSQSFTTSSTGGTVTAIKTYLAKVNAPTDNVIVDIYPTDGAGKPTGSSLGASDPLAASSISTTATQYTFTFSTPVTLSPSTQYAAVFSRSGSVSTDRIALRGNTPVDTDGSQHFCTDNNGVWGTPRTADIHLIVLGPGDLSVAWSSIATRTGFTTAILNIAGYQVGKDIHLVVQDGTMSSSVATKYLSFDAATDTFLATTETVLAASAITGQSTSGWNASLVYRPTAGEVVIFYNSTQTNTSGTPRARLFYRRRTGVNTYATAVQVDPNTATESTQPIAVLGASDRVHLLFFNGTNTMQRHLTSANVLGTAASTGATTAVQDVCRYDDSGTIRHVGYTAAQSIRWSSADNPTVTAASMTTGTPVRATDDSGNPYALYQNSGDSDLYVKTSTDDGATFGSGTNVFTGTVAAAAANLSVNQTVYQRGSNYVIPYIVNDNGTLKYNEYTVRSTGPTGYTLTALTGAVALAGPSVKLAYGHAALVTAGAIAFSGQNVTLTKSGPTIIAQPGAFNLAGQSVTLRVTRRMPVTAGAIAFAGQNVTLAYGHKLQAGIGSFALAGQPVTLRATYKLRALTGTLAIAEQSVRLVYARKGLALTGAITFSGSSVTLTHTLAAVNYTLTALPGVFTLASQPVTLRYAHKLLVTAGTFALAGQPVTLRYGHKLLATVGTFALSGQNVTLFHARRLATLPTTVTLAGQNVTLRYAHKLQASAGAVTLDGQGVTLFYSEEGIVNHTMQPLTGAFNLAGQQVGLRGATKMTPTTGAIVLSGKTVTLRVGYKTQAATGVFTLSGKPVVLRLNRLLGATAGAYVLSGKTVTLRYARKLQVTAGAFALTGTSVNLAYGAGQKLTVLPGGIVLSGKPIRLIQGYTIPVAPGAIVFNGKLTQYIQHRKLKAETGAFEFSRLSAGFDAPIAQPGVIRMGHARVYLKRW